MIHNGLLDALMARALHQLSFLCFYYSSRMKLVTKRRAAKATMLAKTMTTRKTKERKKRVSSHWGQMEKGRMRGKSLRRMTTNRRYVLVDVGAILWAMIFGYWPNCWCSYHIG